MSERSFADINRDLAELVAVFRSLGSPEELRETLECEMGDLYDEAIRNRIAASNRRPI